MFLGSVVLQDEESEASVKYEPESVETKASAFNKANAAGCLVQQICRLLFRLKVDLNLKVVSSFHILRLQ